MHIISFATEETNWRSPRMGIILHARGHDTGYRLDCEKLFDKAERPANWRGSTWMVHGFKSARDARHARA